jgi:hypothetical protein
VHPYRPETRVAAQYFERAGCGRVAVEHRLNIAFQRFKHIASSFRAKNQSAPVASRSPSSERFM